VRPYTLARTVSHRAAAAIPLVLIALCAAAFLRAEQLKLHHSPVAHPHVRQAFSPGCTDPGCLPAARLSFTLRKAQALDLAIVDADGNVTRTIATGRRYRKGPVVLHWDGSTDSGGQAPDGRYRLRACGPADQGSVIDRALSEARDALFAAGQTDVTDCIGRIRI